jgi:hypothetical protein
MDISSLFIANAQAAKLVSPGKRPFDHPTAIAPIRGVALGEPRHDADAREEPAGSPPRYNQGRLTRNQVDGADTRAHSLQGWDGINQRERLPRIDTISPGEQRQTPSPHGLRSTNRQP